MSKRVPIFYNAILITGVNLLLRFVSTSFQVYLSGKIGANGIGILQLVLSVGGLAMTAGMAGIRTATMYLTAEEIGKQRADRLYRVISGCMRYSLVCSCLVSVILWSGSSWIATHWIGEGLAKSAICLFAVFLPISCLSGMMVGHYTGMNRIGTLAVIESVEQIVSMLITISLLNFWAGNSVELACNAVILGSGFGACLTVVLLLIYQKSIRKKEDDRTPIWKEMFRIAIPLAMADNVKAGISTIENLMVPKRLTLCNKIENPVASFGMVCGMVFPVLMFPVSIIYGLAELLIPELARCNAAGSRQRIQYLTRKSFSISLLYGFVTAGFLFVLSDDLCLRLYRSEDAGRFLRLFSLLAPMLYCDAITDAMVKGLGQQVKSVRYNIITSVVDVLLLFYLLPKYGMEGYYVSFVISHLFNFILSVRLLMKHIDSLIPIKMPVFTLVATLISVGVADSFSNVLVSCVVYFAVQVSLMFLLRILCMEDMRWIRGLLSYKKVS